MEIILFSSVGVMMRKPYFWRQRGAWYVNTTDGRHVRLHEDEKKAHLLWAEMQATENPDSPTVQFFVLAENFLGWSKNRISDKTWRGYSAFLVSFCAYKNGGHLLVRDMKPFHVTRWLEANKSWDSPDTQRAAIAAVKRCLRWALEEGYIDKHPLEALKKPKGRQRKTLVAENAHAKLMTAGSRFSSSVRRNQIFRQILIALRHSGARPGSIAALTFDMIRDGGTCWVFENHKTRHKTGKPLTVYPSPCLQTLIKMIQSVRNSGHVFLNRSSTPWTADTIQARLQTLCKRAGVKGIVPYNYRHTYATTALTNGTDLATVAELLGHTSVDMVMKHYGHLDQKKSHMQQAAAKVHRRE
jgi:integrase